MDIISAIESKGLFGPLIKDQATFTNWRVFLRALFGLPMDKGQVKAFKEFTDRKKPPTAQVKEAYVIAGRRSGKSFTAALIACYLALFKDWRPYLTRGEQGFIMCIANDRLQARVILNYIKGILSLRPWTVGGRRIVQKELQEEIQLSNGVVISVKTCDYRSLRGFTVLAAILDEASFFRSEGANPDKEILTALRPALATVPESIMIALSSPYMRAGVMYEAFRDKFGQDDDDVLVWKAPTKAMNPTIDQGIIDKALKDDYAAGQSEWMAEFRTDLESFLDLDLIESCVVSGRRELPALDDVSSYYAFCDPSGGRGDAMTLSICHLENEKIVQDVIRVKFPPLDPAQVAAEFSEVLKDYGLSEVSGDRYAAAWVENSFRDNGASYLASELNKSELYLRLLPLMAQGRVELLDHKVMIAELRGLERRTRSGGKDIVDHGRGAHDDIANSAAGACVLAAEGGARGPLEILWL